MSAKLGVEKQLADLPPGTVGQFELFLAKTGGAYVATSAFCTQSKILGAEFFTHNIDQFARTRIFGPRPDGCARGYLPE